MINLKKIKTTIKKLLMSESQKYILQKDLLKACMNSDFEGFKKAIENGADIFYSNSDALITAVNHNSLEIVDYLSKKEKKVLNIEKAMESAAYFGNIGALKVLIKNGGNIHFNEDKILCEAAINGQLTMIQFLIENGANPNANDNAVIKSALSTLVLRDIDYETSHVKIIKYLVQSCNQNIDLVLNHEAAKGSHKDLIDWAKDWKEKEDLNNLLSQDLVKTNSNNKRLKV